MNTVAELCEVSEHRLSVYLLLAQALLLLPLLVPNVAPLREELTAGSSRGPGEQTRWVGI